MEAMIDVRALADSLGYPAAALGILIESAGIPFPGEAMLLAVAAYAAAGHLDIRLVILCAFVGATVGGDFGYLVGHRGGRPFVERFGRLLRLKPSHLARSEMFFARHGDKAIFLARFVIGARTWGSVLAGMSHMPFLRFQVFSAAGAAIWAILIGGLGYLLGDNWPAVESVIRYLGYGWLVLLLCAAVIYLLARRAAEQT
jgi:membrane protein DedA with SNARE-associated domain